MFNENINPVLSLGQKRQMKCLEFSGKEQRTEQRTCHKSMYKSVVCLYLEYQLQFWSLPPKQDMEGHKRFKTIKDDPRSGISAECSLCMADEG